MFCRVINMDSYSERMCFIPGEMEKIGMQWERFLAVNPPGICDPNIGSAYSHIEVMRDYPDELLVCEDDVMFIEGAKDIFDKSFAQLPSDWDMLYLGGNVKMPAKRYSENLFHVTEGVHCTHAILYSKKGIEITLKNYDVFTNEIKSHDHWLFCVGQKIMECFICFPVIAYQRPGFSHPRNGYMDYYSEMKENEKKHLI